jgi:hypothetical protein
VLSTLHTLDATETINRIIDFFPPHLQQQARVMLAATLKGAVSQRLVPTTDGQGRVAASEIMVVTGRVQDLILNPNETGKISQVIAEGEYYGMQTFDQSLLGHVQSGRVSCSPPPAVAPATSARWRPRRSPTPAGNMPSRRPSPSPRPPLSPRLHRLLPRPRRLRRLFRTDRSTWITARPSTLTGAPHVLRTKPSRTTWIGSRSTGPTTSRAWISQSFTS